MGDDSGSVRNTLHALYFRAQPEMGGREAAKAALGAELERLLYKAASPDEGARAFLVDILYESARADTTGARAKAVDAMAFGLTPGEHPENRRAAGIVHVTRSSEIPESVKRKEALREDAKDGRLDFYARNLAGLLLVKEWREELRQNTDYEFYREAWSFMGNEADYLRGTRVEVAKFLIDFCMRADRALPVLKEIVTSGKWPELAEEAGRWLVEHYIRTGDVGMAKRAVDAPGTARAVKEYAAKRFTEIGFVPAPERAGKRTLTGMPAFGPGRAGEKAGAKGVPPFPGQTVKTTLKGHPVK